MAISIVGAGNVGMALASAFVAKGESVMFGVPDPAKYRDAVSRLGPRARIGGTGDAIAAADVVILAVPYGAAESIARSVDDWNGRILVDATNPLAPGLTGLSVGTTTSGAEKIAKGPAARASSRRSTPRGRRTWPTAAIRVVCLSCQCAVTMPARAPGSSRWPP